MSRRPYLGPSEAQANAEALARRTSPYTAASEVSFRVAWDWHRREPENLREAVHLVRRAYSDEVPEKLHDSAIGDDGTPRMTAKAVGYIFGSPNSDDAGRNPETGERDLVGWYYAPFRALLSEWSCSDEGSRRAAAIVSHVAIGSQEGVAAAIFEGVPPWCAYVVAEHAIRTFWRNLTDIKLHVPKEHDAA